MKCDICLTEGHPRLRCEHGVWYCRSCIGKREYTPIFTFNAKETVSLSVLKNVSKARFEEVGRRVALPYKAPNGEFIIGRRNKDGSISDKAVDLRP